MKRKVNRVGKNTLTISLPQRWTRATGLAKGDELEIIPQGKELIIKRTAEGPRSINLQLNEAFAKRSIFAAYKAGVDRLRITYKPSKVIEALLPTINEAAPGFEIIEQGEDKCLFENISEMGKDTYTTMRKRIFSILRNQAISVNHTVQEGAFATLPTYLIAEQVNNRLTTIARRLLNKGLHENPSVIGAEYALIELSEKVADNWKFLILALCKKKRVSQEVCKRIEEITEQTINLEQATSDETVIATMTQRRKELTAKLIEALSEGKEALVNHHLLTISGLTFDMLGPLLTVHMIERAQEV